MFGDRWSVQVDDTSVCPIYKNETISYRTKRAVLWDTSDTKPVFDQNRDTWATTILTECATIGQTLADRFSGQWGDGIPLVDLREVIDKTDTRNETLVLQGGVLPEPVAAFASRLRGFAPEGHRRRLMMVIDVGAGTTDFAMFARVEREDKIRLCRIKNSVTTIRIGGDAIDDALMDYLLQQAEVTVDHSRRGAIMADLKRDIRLIKEELFRNGSVARRLVNDMDTNASLDQFEECSAMLALQDAMQRKFHQILSDIDSSWLILGNLEVFFTGGGASLNMVTRLARNQPVAVGGSRITPIPVRRTPPWLIDECEDVADSYGQLAVCIGGAYHGAGSTDLDVDRELERFAGDLPDADWKVEGFRDGE